MGTAPSVAIPRAVEKAGLNLNDIDIFEINEAFASQVGQGSKGQGRCGGAQIEGFVLGRGKGFTPFDPASGTCQICGRALRTTSTSPPHPASLGAPTTPSATHSTPTPAHP